MRNHLVRITAVFAVLLITSGWCRPNNGEVDYQGDDDYPDESDNQSSDPGANTPVGHINTAPQIYEVPLGEAVRLPCNVTYPETVTTMWYRDDHLLYSDKFPFINKQDQNRIIRWNDSSLVIYGFSESDASENYTCTITGGDKPESVAHKLRVQRPRTTTVITTTTTTVRPYPPPSPQSVATSANPPISKKLEVHPGPFILVDRMNMDGTLACIANWEPKPKITWSRGGIPIKSDDTPEDGSHLTLRNITIEKAGHYVCLAGQSKSKAFIAHIDVLVPHAPQIRVDQEIIHIGIGMEAELTCHVRGYPEPKVVWHRGDKKLSLKDDTRMEIKDSVEYVHTIVINHTRNEDLAEYTCRATNEHGVANRSITLTGIPREPKFTNGHLGDDDVTPVLEWTVESYSPITKYELKYRRSDEVEWHVLYPMVVESTSNTFTLKHSIPGLKPGSYITVLRAYNDYGWSPEPKVPHVFYGDYVRVGPDRGHSKPSTGGAESLVLLRSSLLLVLSLHVCATYL